MTTAAGAETVTPVPGVHANRTAVAVQKIEYNPVFEKFVDDSDSEMLGIVAYGIYKKAKREWALHIYETQGRSPTADELRAYITTWTPSQIQNARSNAAQALSSYADTVIAAEEPRILAEALKGSFWRDVWPSMTGAFLYTLVLIGVAIVLSRSGVDLLEILRKAGGE